MKIAVFHNLPSGGAKRALYNLVNQLVRMGDSADLYVPSTANESFLNMKCLVTNYTTYEVRRTLRSRVGTVMGLLPPVCAIQKEIGRDINSRDYDLVLSEQDSYTMSPFLLRYVTKPTAFYCQQPSRAKEAVLAKVRALAPTRNATPFYRVPWRLYRRHWLDKVEKENASFASCILANSYFSREEILRTYGLNASVSYLGVDTRLFRPLPLARENFILSVGACGPHKGFDFLIRAIGRIESSRRPRLVIVSNMKNPDWDLYLRNLADRLGVQVEIKNQAVDDELVALYNRAKAFVYTPYLEPFGLAPLEAMACATPVVAVKEGGIRESVKDGSTGILIERDEKAFADGLCDLLASDRKRKALGENGADAVREFWTWEHAGERLRTHLWRTLGSAPQHFPDRQSSETATSPPVHALKA